MQDYVVPARLIRILRGSVRFSVLKTHVPPDWVQIPLSHQMVDHRKTGLSLILRSITNVLVSFVNSRALILSTTCSRS